MSISSSKITRLFSFISRLLNSLWLFFPAILFLFLFIFCFWLLGQGKDIIVAFAENKFQNKIGLSYTRIIFFLAIGFWAYVSWYTSRIISYIKKSQEENAIKEISRLTGKGSSQQENIIEVKNELRDDFPRLIGNACFLVLELAVLQSPQMHHPLNFSAALIIFIASLVLMWYFNKWLAKNHAEKPWFRKVFNILSISLAALIVISSFFYFDIITLLHWLFYLLLLFHTVFIFYTNLRRVEVEKKEEQIHREMQLNRHNRIPGYNKIFEKIMNYFCVPLKESAYFKWCLLIGGLGLFLYLLVIIWLFFARSTGPFPFIILGFGVLLAFGNVVTAFSILYRVNFHFILLLIALLLNPFETHYVRTIKTIEGNNYSNRPQLNQYLAAWLNDRNVITDSSRNGYDVYFIMANGGASRSGYWTASVLGKIEDSSLIHNTYNRFSDHVFCLSGTSGGGVGVATFFSLLREKENRKNYLYETSAKEFLKMDYFTYTFARMLGPDFFNYIFHIPIDDRASALERSFEETSRNYDTTLYQVPFYDAFSKFPALKNGKVFMPILCVNTTRMQDGNPGVVTNLKLDSATFNNRVDVLKLLDASKDISITSASILGARFPYLSPAGRISNIFCGWWLF